MIVNELQLPSTMSRAKQKLEQMGYRYLGGGLFGSVYGQNEKDVIVKLFHSYDAGYIAFVKFCLMPENRGNPHLPKFRGKLIEVNDDYYAVRMEKLSPITDSQGGEICGLLYYSMKMLLLPPERRWPEYENSWNELQKTQPDLAQLLKKLAKYCENNSKVRPDLHADNAMYRGKTIVITDPLAAASH